MPGSPVYPVQYQSLLKVSQDSLLYEVICTDSRVQSRSKNTDGFCVNGAMKPQTKKTLFQKKKGGGRHYTSGKKMESSEEKTTAGK
jgi:hypothetical protein